MKLNTINCNKCSFKRKLRGLIPVFVWFFPLVFLSVLLLLSFISLPLTVSADTVFYIDENGEQKPSICGDLLCTIGENNNNCPIDCMEQSFASNLDISLINIDYGTVFRQNLIIENFDINRTLFQLSSNDTQILPMSLLENQNYLTSNISEITLFLENEEILIENRSISLVEVAFYVPLEYSFDSYSGSLVVSNDKESIVTNFILDISSGPSTSSQSKISLLNRPSLKNPLLFSSSISFPYYVENIAVTYYLLTESNSLVLIGTSDTFSGAQFSYLGSVDLSNFLTENDLPAKYSLLMVWSEDGLERNNQVSFEVRFSFLESRLFTVFLFLFIGIPVLFIIFRVILYFRTKALAKRRYILPNFKLLPGKSDTLIEVGKIADTDFPAFFNSSDLTTHALVAGSTGSGKSVTASVIVEEILNKKIPAVIFDPTSQWTGFLSPLKDPNIFNFYPQFKLQKDDARSYTGMIFTPKDENFDINFDDYLKPGEVTVFNLANLTTVQYDVVVEKIVNLMFAKRWEESSNLKLVVVFDEVHRLLDKSAKGRGYAALTKACREFRKWGLGLVMASQVSSDFKEAIGGNVLTEVQLNTKNLEDIKKIGKKYGNDYSQRVTRMGIGVALVQNPRYNNGKPWFIQFRPPLHNPHKLSEEALQMYEDFSVKLKLILEKIHKQTSSDTKEDLLMDYNLAFKKLKEGKFKMSEIYIQSLEDRLK